MECFHLATTVCGKTQGMLRTYKPGTEGQLVGIFTGIFAFFLQIVIQRLSAGLGKHSNLIAAFQFATLSLCG